MPDLPTCHQYYSENATKSDDETSLQNKMEDNHPGLYLSLIYTATRHILLMKAKHKYFLTKYVVLLKKLKPQLNYNYWKPLV